MKTTPGRARTCYPLLRRQMLYPDELRGQLLLSSASPLYHVTKLHFLPYYSKTKLNGDRSPPPVESHHPAPFNCGGKYPTPRRCSQLRLVSTGIFSFPHSRREISRQAQKNANKAAWDSSSNRCGKKPRPSVPAAVITIAATMAGEYLTDTKVPSNRSR